jgi:Carboxypeptidase regulatory-like domain/TonB-dependent Receptor Plug Domain
MPQKLRCAIQLLLLAIWSCCMFAQTETGQIRGVVTDPTGAIVGGAKITVVSTATGATRTTSSNSNGEYAITALEPAVYTLSAEGTGFQKWVRRVQVTVGSSNVVPVAFAVQGTSATVEVSAEPSDVHVETESQELSQVVSSQQITELPTLTRNPYALVATSGNVTEDQGAFGSRGAGFNINGQRSASTDILLDGGENVDLFTASVGQSVPLDSVQEFRVISNDFSAEYGRASGGIVNVATAPTASTGRRTISTAFPAWPRTPGTTSRPIRREGVLRATSSATRSAALSRRTSCSSLTAPSGPESAA